MESKSYAGWTWEYSYNDKRQVENYTDVDLQETTYGYDNLLRLDKITERGGARITDISYSFVGLGANDNSVTTSITTDVDIPILKEEFDGFGRGMKTIKEGYTFGGGDYVTNQTYDAFGRVISICDPENGACVTNEYEPSPLSRIIRKQVTGAPTAVHILYGTNTVDDATGFAPNTLFKVTEIDENGYPNTTFTDAAGRTMLLRKSLNGENVDTYYRYNNKGELFQVVQPNGETFEYHYYPEGLLHTKKVPGAGIVTYEYNDRNQLWKETDANGNVLEYTFNEYDQPTQVRLTNDEVSNALIQDKVYYEDGTGKKGRINKDISYSLDGLNTFTHTLNYDEFGRVETESREHPIAKDDYTYSYDHRDLTQSVNRIHHSPDGDVPIFKDIEYDHGGRLDYVEITIGNQPTKRILQNTYNEVDWLTQQNLGLTPGIGWLQSVDYEYNYRGWLTKINDVGECNGTSPGLGPGGGYDITSLTQDGEVSIKYNAQDIVSGTATNIKMQYNMEISSENEVLFHIDQASDLNIGGFVEETNTNYTHQREYTISGQMNEESIALIITSDILSDANSLVQGQVVNSDREKEINDKVLNRLKDNPKDEDCLNVEGDLFAQQLYYDNVYAHPELNNKRQFNGNISMMKWRVLLPGRYDVDYYGFEYDGVYDPTNTGANSTNDGLGMLTQAKYAQKSVLTFPNGSTPWLNQGRYDVGISYNDNAGNIGAITRNGVVNNTNGAFNYGITDDLVFSYDDPNNLNQLSTVSESESYEHGFKGGFKVYEYDNNGNIIQITTDDVNMNISYNHFNLPKLISDDETGGTIKYLYDGSGRKMTKIVTGADGYTRHYVDGIEYLDNSIEAIYNQVGRFLMSDQRFEYTLKDHLGNSRVMFSDVNNDGIIDPSVDAEEVVQENHYYPFGMEMEGEWGESISPINNYRYNGKELQNDFGLAWLDYGARFYNPAIGKWGQIDPLAEKNSSFSPYNYVFNAPISFIDPDGRDGIRVIDMKNKTITIRADYFVVTQPTEKEDKEFVRYNPRRIARMQRRTNRKINRQLKKLKITSGKYKGFSVKADLRFHDGGNYGESYFKAYHTKIGGHVIGNVLKKGEKNNPYFGELTDPTTGKSTAVGGATSPTNDIITMSTVPGKDTYSNRIHEMFHTLGMSHPKGTGGLSGIMHYPPEKINQDDINFIGNGSEGFLPETRFNEGGNFENWERGFLERYNNAQLNVINP